MQPYDVDIMYKGGRSSHYTNCDRTHWDCAIRKLEKQVAELEKEIADLRALLNIETKENRNA